MKKLKKNDFRKLAVLVAGGTLLTGSVNAAPVDMNSSSQMMAYAGCGGTSMSSGAGSQNGCHAVQQNGYTYRNAPSSSQYSYDDSEQAYNSQGGMQGQGSYNSQGSSTMQGQNPYGNQNGAWQGQPQRQTYNANGSYSNWETSDTSTDRLNDRTVPSSSYGPPKAPQMEQAPIQRQGQGPHYQATPGGYTADVSRSGTSTNTNSGNYNPNSMRSDGSYKGMNSTSNPSKNTMTPGNKSSMKSDQTSSSQGWNL